MTLGELMKAVESAVAHAFPDRAASLMAALERRMWFSVETLPEPAESGADVELLALEMAASCSVCRRELHGDLSLARVTSERGLSRYGGRAPEISVIRGSLRAPFIVCAACRVVGGEDPSHDDAVLADLVRALRVSDVAAADATIAELERRFARVSLPAMSKEPCVACGVPGPNRGELCASCWARAKGLGERDGSPTGDQARKERGE